MQPSSPHEGAPSAPAGGPPQSMPAPHAAQTPAAAAQTPTQSAAPAMADDSDLIEKEWVAQVKQVFTGHAGDPYEQNKELSRLKAEYLQKRYGKDIKVDS